MNKSIEEIMVTKPMLSICQNGLKTRIFVVSQHSQPKGFNPGGDAQLKNNKTKQKRIIKIDKVLDSSLNNVNIDYNHDKVLIDKLFEIKNTLKMKKKTFL